VSARLFLSQEKKNTTDNHLPFFFSQHSAERLQKAATELSHATGQRCIPVAADVREPAQVQAAVATALAAFGRLDFVICAAAGNFLAPISGLTEKGFRTVIEIDVVCFSFGRLSCCGLKREVADVDCLDLSHSSGRTTLSRRRSRIYARPKARTST
jgi:NAD(P)-dependent dehydrogenase (short-subunit alcohol dehydrogenase family)